MAELNFQFSIFNFFASTFNAAQSMALPRRADGGGVTDAAAHFRMTPGQGGAQETQRRQKEKQSQHIQPPLARSTGRADGCRAVFANASTH